MALASISVPPDPKRDARARALVPQVGSWPLFTLKRPWGSFAAGTVFCRAYGSDGARYLVNAVACQCPDYAEHGHICKHIRAVVLWEAEQVDFDAEIARVLGPAPLKRYEALYPACKSGCGDVSETRDGYCDRCASDREWEARREAFASIAPFTLNPLAE